MPFPTAEFHHATTSDGGGRREGTAFQIRFFFFFKQQRFLALLRDGGVTGVLIVWAAKPCVASLPRELSDLVAYLPAISTEPTFGLLSKLSLQILPIDLCVVEGF